MKKVINEHKFKELVQGNTNEELGVRFKPHCSLSKNELMFDDVIEAYNDPNDSLRIHDK